MYLFVTGDAVHFARMFIVDFVVANPQLERKVRAQRDELVELHGIADGPWDADDNCEDKGKQKRLGIPTAETRSTPAKKEAANPTQDLPSGKSPRTHHNQWRRAVEPIRRCESWPILEWRQVMLIAMYPKSTQTGE